MEGSCSENDDFGDTGALQRRVPSRHTEKTYMKMTGQFAKCTEPIRKVMIFASQGHWHNRRGFSALRKPV